jgi:hypothetical protein
VVFGLSRLSGFPFAKNATIYQTSYTVLYGIEYAERSRCGNGGRPYLERSGVKVVSKVPGWIAPGTFDIMVISVFCSKFLASRGGGTRTHTPKGPGF